MALLKDAKEITVPNYNYRQLEYIHFSGAEYINTNKTLTGPNTYKRAIMKVSFQNVNRWSYCGYIGNSNNFCFGTRPTNLVTYSLGGVSYSANAYALSTNTIYQYDLWVNNANSNSLSIFDEAGTVLWTSSALSATWSGNTGELYIGAANQNGSAVSYMIANIYSFTIRQPSFGVIVYNGIPCQRKSDNVCGMYDTISNTFQPMVGTEITNNAAGPTIAENMPMYVNKIESNNQIIWGSQTAFPYRRLEYIKFSGAEYVDTNTALPTGNTYKRFDLILDFQNSSNWGVNGFDSGTNNRFNMGVNGNGYARYGSGSTNTWQDSDGYKFSLNAKYGLVLWASSGSTNMTIWQNGSDIWRSATKSTSFTSATGNLYIGAVNNNGSVAAYCEEKVYSARLASGSYAGQLFLGIPCQRKSDGVCGLYDAQNNVFRPMIGTNITDAAAGPLVDEYWNLQA